MNNIVDYGLREAYKSMKSMDRLSQMKCFTHLRTKREIKYDPWCLKEFGMIASKNHIFGLNKDNNY